MASRKKNETDVSVQILLPRDLHERMVEAAKQDRRTRGSFVLIAIEERINQVTKANTQ